MALAAEFSLTLGLLSVNDCCPDVDVSVMFMGGSLIFSTTTINVLLFCEKKQRIMLFVLVFRMTV